MSLLKSEIERSTTPLLSFLHSLNFKEKETGRQNSMSGSKVMLDFKCSPDIGGWWPSRLALNLATPLLSAETGKIIHSLAFN